MNPRHARRLSAIACGTLVLAVSALAYFGARGGSGIPQEIWWLRVTGYGALVLLCLAILVTPAWYFLERLRPGLAMGTTLGAWRRSFGIASAWLALGHAATALNTYLDWSWTTIWNTTYLRAGAVALIILAALLVTSFPFLIKRLHVRFWKQLHRLAYVAILLVFQHTVLSPFASRRWIFTIFGLVLLLSLFRLLPRPRPNTKREKESESSSFDPEWLPGKTSAS